MVSKLRFVNRKIESENKSWEIEDVLGIEFYLDLDGKSKVTFSVKKPKVFTSVLKSFVMFLGKIAVAYFSVVFLAKYSVLLALLLSLLLLKLIVPIYWKIFKGCHSSGIYSFYFEDPILFITFQKSIWDDHRGRKLIKTGFVLGQAFEEVFFVFFPPSIYNSELFRRYLKILVQVIYPIIVIIIPLFLGFCVAIGKNLKFIYKALRKDRFIKLIWTVAEEGIELIEDVADDYKWSRKVWKFLDNGLDLIAEGFEVVFSWLRMEFLLVFMQIEYVNHCYIAVWKSFLSSSKFVGRVMKRLGFGWFVKSVEVGMARLNSVIKVDEIRNTLEIKENLVRQVEDVQDKLDKKNL